MIRIISAITTLMMFVICITSCATKTPLNADASSRIKYTVIYEDRNDDGKIDYEKHKAIGACDADWELIDDDFDGRYERQIGYGYAVKEEAVDMPVPIKGERIEK